MGVWEGSGEVRALELPGRMADVLARAIDPPEPQTIVHAVGLLQSLGAVEFEPGEEERLTSAVCFWYGVPGGLLNGAP